MTIRSEFAVDYKNDIMFISFPAGLRGDSSIPVSLGVAHITSVQSWGSWMRIVMVRGEEFIAHQDHISNFEEMKAFFNS